MTTGKRTLRFMKEYIMVSYLFTIPSLSLVLEVYQWLGNKYEKEFIEMDLCKVLIDRVCEIIDSILLSND
jgi:hypothetical protein